MKQLFLLLSFIPFLLVAQPNDHLIANHIFSDAYEHKLIEKPMGDVMVFVGRDLVGSPYEAGTLDKADSEQLVVNLHSFDCVTFVENVLALSLCIKNDYMTFDAYTDKLRQIRYRGGTIDGYPSRLHYFTDWVFDNEKKGVIQDITKKLGGERYTKHIDFMTTHRSSYPKLANDSNLTQLKAAEDSLNNRNLYYIPKSQIQHLKSKLRNGDIIAITTNTDGLDISHVGIAIRMEDGTIHYMHTPDIGEKVTITSETLAQYLAKHRNQTGVIVARPVQP
jgi:hypothetical protein